uniref:Uncharacterized protein n=1 Tax=Rhizophagus irregularis (strain DAOM 181602 / DAOM 197198 / MUCL 43194) TaxID=747089 RepID=U9TCX8_RHIID
MHYQEREDFQIYVQCISSLQTGIEEQICNQHENEKSICILPTASEQVGLEGLNGSLYMVVDTFVDESVRRNLASSILCDLPTNSADPEKLGCYYKCIAEFGFNHIIVIGEMLYGLLFIDCYGRVFQWEDMEQVLWPVGDSLEDMKPYKDLVIWTVEDGVVYEESKDSLKPSSVKEKFIVIYFSYAFKPYNILTLAVIPEPSELKLIIITYKPAKSVLNTLYFINQQLYPKPFHTMTQYFDMPQDFYLRLSC